MRLNRSIRFSVSPEPMDATTDGLKLAVSALKFAVSTTSVSPSQRPRELPSHWRRSSGSGARPSRGTMRASCTISFRMTTCSAVWKIWMFWL